MSDDLPLVVNELALVPYSSTRMHAFWMQVLGSNRTYLAVKGLRSLCLVAKLGIAFPQKI